jgi:hypothetical protein
MARQGAVLLLFMACLALLGAGAGGSAQRLDYAAVALNVWPPGEC